MAASRLVAGLIGALFAVLAAEPAGSSPLDGSSAEPRVRLTCEFQLRPDNLPILNCLQRGGWCWAVASRPEMPEEMFPELTRRELRAVVTVLAHPESRRRQWSDEWKLAVPDLAQVMTRYRQALGTNFGWEAFTEDDSMGVGFSKDLLAAKPPSHAAAWNLFRDYLARAQAEMRPHAGVERWGRCGYASGAHPLAALGLHCVLVERANDDIEDLQTAIAFARGAARQYGCQWGVEFSLWWGVIYGCVHDLPASFHKRNFYLSYFSGANVLAVEGGNLLVRLPEIKATPLGETLDEFGRFTRCVQPGMPDVPVAVLLPEDHGWITPPYWRTSNEAWNYARIPYRPGDRSLDGFFATAFPGANFAMDPFPFGAYATNDPPASPFALSCVTPEYAPLAENVFTTPSPLPFGKFKSRSEARSALKARHRDPAPWRPLGDSRWGDIVDVLTATAPLAVLQRYPLLVLLGPIELRGQLRQTLDAYVRGGGRLVVAAGVVGPSHRDLCGASLEPELRVGRAWRWGEEQPVSEPFRYLPARTGEGVAVLARTPGGDPLTIRHRLGKGEVYTCLLPWFGSGEAPWATLARRLLDELIRPIQPVQVEGLPVEWLSTRGADHRTVVIANHDGQSWRGTVRVREVPAEFSQCRELLTGRPIPFSHEGSERLCAVEVPPYEIRALRWEVEREQERSPAGKLPENHRLRTASAPGGLGR